MSDHTHPTFVTEEAEEEQQMIWLVGSILVVGLLLSALALWWNIRRIE